MTEVISRIKVNGKNFEILVDVDKAVEYKKTGKGSIASILGIDAVYSDSKKRNEGKREGFERRL